MHMSPMVEGEVERAKRKRATVIVTRFEDLFLMPMRGYVSLYVYHESRSFFDQILSARMYNFPMTEIRLQ